MEPVAAETGEGLFKGRSLESLKRMFQLAEEAHQNARTLAFRDRDWYDNFNDNQWSDGEKKTLTSRNQDPATRNEIKRKVNFLIGMEQRSRTDPRAFPRNPQDENGANVATDCLDYIETSTRFDRTASAGFKDLAIEGIEAGEVVVENGNITINRIDYGKFFYDPRSRELDFSDARYMGYADWWDYDEAIDLFVRQDMDEAKRLEIETALSDTLDSAAFDEGFDDKPEGQWGDKDRRRVRIVVIYYKGSGGQWNYAYFTGGGTLSEGPSAYLDETGKPTNCIIAQSAYATRENQRYGLVRDMIALQREVNHRLSLSLFLLKNRRMWQNRKGVLDQNARTQAAKADGIITANGEYGREWGFVDVTAEVAGNFELLQQALQGMAAQGPNAGMQGRGVEDQSGKAIIAQQNAGLTEENTIYDAHNDWKLRIYRAMWERAKQFWTKPDFIRVTDEEEAFRFVPVNQPMTMGDKIAEQPPEQQPTLMQSMGMMPGDPRLSMPMLDNMGQPILKNPLAQMDVDIIIEAAPDVITLQHEEFQQIVELAKSGIPIPPDVLIEASQLRDKRKLLTKMKEAEAAQAQDPMLNVLKQLEVAQRQADLKQTQIETEETISDIALNKVKVLGETAENLIRERAAASPAKVSVSA